MEVTAERLRELLDYDPISGLFRWKQPTSNRVKVGSLAKCIDGNGYVAIRIDGRLYRAHRLAFLFMTGCFPVNDVDHRNGCRTDNSWANLREATRQQNLRNKRIENPHGIRGVRLLPNGKWRARITVSRKSIHLGCFSDATEAGIAYEHAAQKHFGDFARTF